MTIVVLVRKRQGGSEVITGQEPVARAIAEELGGAVEKRKGLWVVTLPLGPGDVAERLSGMSVGGQELRPHIVKLSRRSGITVCPVCGSPRIKPIGVSGWLTPALYECEDCGYVGRIVLEISD